MRGSHSFGTHTPARFHWQEYLRLPKRAVHAQYAVLLVGVALGRAGDCWPLESMAATWPLESMAATACRSNQATQTRNSPRHLRKCQTMATSEGQA